MKLQNQLLGWCPLIKDDCKADCMWLAKYSDNKCCSMAVIAASSDYILDSILEISSKIRKEQVK